MIEEKKYKVTLILQNIVTFSPIERGFPITRSDAIENAMGTVFDEVWKTLEDEGWKIRANAKEI